MYFTNKFGKLTPLLGKRLVGIVSTNPPEITGLARLYLVMEDGTSLEIYNRSGFAFAYACKEPVATILGTETGEAMVLESLPPEQIAQDAEKYIDAKKHFASWTTYADVEPNVVAYIRPRVPKPDAAAPTAAAPTYSQALPNEPRHAARAIPSE